MSRQEQWNFRLYSSKKRAPYPVEKGSKLDLRKIEESAREREASAPFKRLDPEKRKGLLAKFGYTEQAPATKKQLFDRAPEPVIATQSNISREDCPPVASIHPVGDPIIISEITPNPLGSFAVFPGTEEARDDYFRTRDSTLKEKAATIVNTKYTHQPQLQSRFGFASIKNAIGGALGGLFGRKNKPVLQNS